MRTHMHTNTRRHTHIQTHTKFIVEWWRQRLASTPLAESTQSTGHTIGNGSRSAGLSLQGRRQRQKERRLPPPNPNYSKLFCWMTDFISDQSRRKKTEGRVGVYDEVGACIGDQFDSQTMALYSEEMLNFVTQNDLFKLFPLSFQENKRF